MEEYMFPCLTKKMIGLDCPGCGTQRAFVFLIEGKPLEAWQMYPPIYTLLLFVIALGIHFLDFKRSHHKLIIFTGVLNAVTMIIAYVYKWISMLYF